MFVLAIKNAGSTTKDMYDTLTLNKTKLDHPSW